MPWSNCSTLRMVHYLCMHILQNVSLISPPPPPIRDEHQMLLLYLITYHKQVDPLNADVMFSNKVQKRGQLPIFQIDSSLTYRHDRESSIWPELSLSL